MKKICIFLCLTLTSLFFCGCSINSLLGDKGGSTSSPSYTFLNKLYKYKDTNVGDNLNISAIINALPFTGIKSHVLELNTIEKPYGLTVTYKASEREAYARNPVTYRNLRQDAAVIMALVKNADFVRMIISDGYSDFITTYFDRNTLYQQFDMDYFTVEAINNAANDKETLEKYLGEVYILQPEESVKTIENTIYSTLEDDQEIILNSGRHFKITFSSNIKIPKFDLSEYCSTKGINPKDYYGKQIDCYIYGVRNYKTNITMPYIYVFHGENLITSKSLLSDDNMNIAVETLSKLEN